MLGLSVLSPSDSFCPVWPRPFRCRSDFDVVPHVRRLMASLAGSLQGGSCVCHQNTPVVFFLRLDKTALSFVLCGLWTCFVSSSWLWLASFISPCNAASVTTMRATFRYVGWCWTLCAQPGALPSLRPCGFRFSRLAHQNWWHYGMLVRWVIMRPRFFHPRIHREREREWTQARRNSSPYCNG